MREQADTKTKTENRGRARLLRAAAVAIGVVLFLFAFRPFGLTVDSAAEVLVLLGVAPINFLLMLMIHALPLRAEPWRAVVAIGILIVGNTLYLATWSQRVNLAETLLAVGLVVGLTATIAWLWNKGRIPEQDINVASSQSDSLLHTVALSGDGEQEILQLAPSELLYLKANGNYVDVHYLKKGLPAQSMLRSSLARLAGEVPQGILVQCHRSYFVNLALARRIVRAKGQTLIEFDSGDRVPVSRKHNRDVLEAISA